MNKFFSFSAGAICGVLVGASIAILFTPASGEEVMTTMQQRLQNIGSEMKNAQREKEQDVYAHFEQAKQN